MNRAQAIDSAISLMEGALQQLDSVNETGAAAYLQQAINELTGAPRPQTVEQAEVLLETPEARAILERHLACYQIAIE
jgi:hypothetical protein